jgi:uncharacterized protein
VGRFDWDAANYEHIAEHDVSPREAEYVVLHDPLDLEVQVREREERFVQVGATPKGRILVVVSTVRGDLVRVVTAFDAPRRYRLAYERWRGGRGESYGTKA